MRVLFATSEVQPLIKAGGLAEVSLGLPRALRRLGHDVRLVLPGYPPAMRAVTGLQEYGRLQTTPAGETIRILAGAIQGMDVPIYLIDAPTYFQREGGPYANADGDEWADNAERFSLFCGAIVDLAMGRINENWATQLVHCNDWQTGLVPALLSHEPDPPATLFTVHNLAAQGLFSWDVFHRLLLPRPLWTRHGLEHYGNFSFMKGGLAFADRINTVSPTYAREIQTEGMGCGLDEVLRRHGGRLSGILNGVDYEIWDPGNDPNLAANYEKDTLTAKAANKRALQRWLDLPQDEDALVLTHAGRLLERRGSDLLLEAVPRLRHLGAQLVVLGQGDRALEDAWSRAASQNPTRVAAVIGEDEALAHLLNGGGDVCVVPSRFEPCGLDQLHAMRYGTIPVVHQTGGLADTVADAGPESAVQPNATGYCYSGVLAPKLLQTLERAASLHRMAPERWRTLILNGMAKDFGWERSAERYVALYEETLQSQVEARAAASRH